MTGLDRTTQMINEEAAAEGQKILKEASVKVKNIIDETEVPVWSALNDAFCLYAGAFLSLKGEEDSGMELKPLNGSSYALHIDAERHMMEGNYEAAYQCLHSILVSDERIPEPMMYYVFCDLEICCKERGDFKGAYENSITKMELLQTLLS